MATHCLLLFFFILLGMRLSSAEVYKVGDDQGWTKGAVDYKNWASEKRFHVGDTLVFQYNNNYHNVLKVSQEEYKACVSKSPIATYTSGKDSITLESKENHYFICGFPRHCDSGMKIKIKAHTQKGSSSDSPSVPGGSTSPNSGGSNGGGEGNTPSGNWPCPPLDGGGGSNNSPVTHYNDAPRVYKELGLAATTAAVLLLEFLNV